MKAKLIVEGRELSIEINDLELKKLLKSQKKTGYERAEKDEQAFYVGLSGIVMTLRDYRSNTSNDAYISGNYYSDKTVAENNARADELMRRLRRFAAEHRDEELDWNNGLTDKYCIRYNHEEKLFHIISWSTNQQFSTIYFDSRKNAELAINTFREELIWYFTEYKDSL